MNPNYLDFEQPIAELDAKIEALRLVGSDSEINIGEEITRLQAKSRELTASVFRNLSAWQITQLARHPLRPYSLDYISRIFSDFDELHGDRTFADDHALVAGIARLEGEPVMVIGQQKGRDTKEKIYRNFGMLHPEGYRRAKRLMEMAEKFSLPVITFIDTPGAYPGIEAEARGQSEAIARNLFDMAKLKAPIIAVVIGEGCSGGALGIGVGDRVLMLQYSYYATISPEGCATILFKSAEKAPEAAEIMGITAERLLALGLIDGIIPEPLGGAHRDVERMASMLKTHLVNNLQLVKSIPNDRLVDLRYKRWMALGET
ncbi:MAG: acetyl-CoA carboxylase carboxyltransferase subunit alpha [Gammaproteobacteria bacterium 39-13]|nr:acetyl-CoA carboxylase carboxyltransferase subunit alpha [Gammaproteobacteria bacterium]OJV85244.1 MAG: acetyl-CoA carboxylase carboxyltransferase subunit alpha [Gammaproteobacteria bacterium 39-13]